MVPHFHFFPGKFFFKADFYTHVSRRSYYFLLVRHSWFTCDQPVTHEGPYCYSLVTVYLWNFWKLYEILFKIAWNFLKNWVKFSENLREILLKLSEIILKIAWYYLKRYVKFSFEMCTILLKIAWNFLKNRIQLFFLIKYNFLKDWMIFC